MTANLSHGGVAVTMSPAGVFEATVGGVVLKAPSFAAMKKKIEKAGAFAPFEAFTMRYGYGGTSRFTVTGTRPARKSQQRYYGSTRYVFVCSDGEERAHVTRVTPENEAALAEFEALQKLHEKQREDMEKQRRAVANKIKEETADAIVDATKQHEAAK